MSEAVSTTIRVHLLKARPDQQVVVGWAYKSERADGSPFVDHSGEHIPFAELENTPIELMAMGSRESGAMHEEYGGVEPLGAIALDSKEREALGFGPGESGLIVKLRVRDEKLWKRVRDGELTELSIEGKAIREEYRG